MPNLTSHQNASLYLRIAIGDIAMLKIAETNVGRRTYLRAIGAGALVSPVLARTAAAKDDSSRRGSFTVTMVDGEGAPLASWQPGPDGDDTRVRVPAASVGSRLEVRGRFVEFDVDLSTFAVLEYTITGANTLMTDGESVIVFTRKVPLHGQRLDGDLELRVRDSDLRVLRENSSDLEMKIQAKDEIEGGIFQMEPSTTMEYRHELGPGFRYIFDERGRVLLTNGPRTPTPKSIVARESPENATLVGGDSGPLTEGMTVSRWTVSAGGRMGFVSGEDAME